MSLTDDSFAPPGGEGTPSDPFGLPGGDGTRSDPFDSPGGDGTRSDPFDSPGGDGTRSDPFDSPGGDGTQSDPFGLPGGDGTRSDPFDSPGGDGTRSDPFDSPGGDGTQSDPFDSPGGDGTQSDPFDSPGGDGTQSDPFYESAGFTEEHTTSEEELVAADLYTALQERTTPEDESRATELFTALTSDSSEEVHLNDVFAFDAYSDPEQFSFESLLEDAPSSFATGGPGALPDLGPGFALEARAETINVLTLGDAVRRGDLDTVQIGGAQILDLVTGEENLEITGEIREHTGRDLTIVASRSETTVGGRMRVECSKEDSIMLGGAMTDTWEKGVLIGAAMSDDLCGGAGTRVSVADLWLNGLTGMEERPGTAASDGVFLELCQTLFEREYGAGMHAAGAVKFSGTTWQTQKTGFRPMMKVRNGVRNLVAGAPEVASEPPPTPPPTPPPAAGATPLVVAGVVTAGASIARGAANTAVAVDSVRDIVRLGGIAGDVDNAADLRHAGDTAVQLEDLRTAASQSGQGGAQVDQMGDAARLTDTTDTIDFATPYASVDIGADAGRVDLDTDIYSMVDEGAVAGRLNSDPGVPATQTDTVADRMRWAQQGPSVQDTVRREKGFVIGNCELKASDLVAQARTLDATNPEHADMLRDTASRLMTAADELRRGKDPRKHLQAAVDAADVAKYPDEVAELRKAIEEATEFFDRMKALTPDGSYPPGVLDFHKTIDVADIDVPDHNIYEAIDDDSLSSGFRAEAGMDRPPLPPPENIGSRVETGMDLDGLHHTGASIDRPAMPPPPDAVGFQAEAGMDLDGLHHAEDADGGYEAVGGGGLPSSSRLSPSELEAAKLPAGFKVDDELARIDDAISNRLLKIEQAREEQLGQINDLISRKLTELEGIDASPGASTDPLPSGSGGKVTESPSGGANVRWPGDAAQGTEARRAQLQAEVDALTVIKGAIEAHENPNAVLQKMLTESANLHGVADPWSQALVDGLKYNDKLKSVGRLDAYQGAVDNLMLARSEILAGRDPSFALRKVPNNADGTVNTWARIGSVQEMFEGRDWQRRLSSVTTAASPDTAPPPSMFDEMPPAYPGLPDEFTGEEFRLTIDPPPYEAAQLDEPVQQLGGSAVPAWQADIPKLWAADSDVDGLRHGLEIEPTQVVGLGDAAADAARHVDVTDVARVDFDAPGVGAVQGPQPQMGESGATWANVAADGGELASVQHTEVVHVADGAELPSVRYAEVVHVADGAGAAEEVVNLHHVDAQAVVDGMPDVLAGGGLQTLDNPGARNFEQMHDTLSRQYLVYRRSLEWHEVIETGDMLRHFRVELADTYGAMHKQLADAIVAAGGQSEDVIGKVDDIAGATTGASAKASHAGLQQLSDTAKHLGEDDIARRIDDYLESFDQRTYEQIEELSNRLDELAEAKAEFPPVLDPHIDQKALQGFADDQCAWAMKQMELALEHSPLNATAMQYFSDYNTYWGQVSQQIKLGLDPLVDSSGQIAYLRSTGSVNQAKQADVYSKFHDDLVFVMSKSDFQRSASEMGDTTYAPGAIGRIDTDAVRTSDYGANVDAINGQVGDGDYLQVPQEQPEGLTRRKPLVESPSVVTYTDVHGDIFTEDGVMNGPLADAEVTGELQSQTLGHLGSDMFKRGEEITAADPKVMEAENAKELKEARANAMAKGMDEVFKKSGWGETPLNSRKRASGKKVGFGGTDVVTFRTVTVHEHTEMGNILKIQVGVDAPNTIDASQQVRFVQAPRGGMRQPGFGRTATAAGEFPFSVREQLLNSLMQGQHLDSRQLADIDAEFVAARSGKYGSQSKADWRRMAMVLRDLQMTHLPDGSLVDGMQLTKTARSVDWKTAQMAQSTAFAANLDGKALGKLLDLYESATVVI